MSNSEKPSPQSHQRDKLNVRKISIVAAGLLLGIAAILASIYVALALVLPASSAVPPDVQWKRASTSPGVEPTQAFGYQQLLAEQQRILNSYRWQDEDHAFARIPIERAMEIMASQSEPEPVTQGEVRDD